MSDSCEKDKKLLVFPNMALSLTSSQQGVELLMPSLTAGLLITWKVPWLQPSSWVEGQLRLKNLSMPICMVHLGSTYLARKWKSVQ